jgi:diacylglycerol kinase family enzyme
MTRALLIANPVAARTDPGAVRAVLDTLRRGGWQVDSLATHAPEDARRFAEEAQTAAIDVLVSYGGDGTAMQIAAAIVGTGIPIGLVPGGTGNLLAGNLRLPRRPDAAARAILRGRPRPIDLGAVERPGGTRYFAVACGAGFDAELMAGTAAAAKQRWKMGAYVARAITTLPDVRSVVHRVTVDGAAHVVEAAMVLVANCGELIPPFLRLGRGVHPDDGWLDVIAVRADGVIGSVAAFVDVLRGVEAGAPRVWSARCRVADIAVTEGPPRPVQLDGDAAGETPVAMRLLPHALRVLVPPDRAAS